MFRAFIPFVNLVDLNVHSHFATGLYLKLFVPNISLTISSLDWSSVNLDGKLISEAIFLFWSSFYRSIHPLFLKDLLLMFVNFEKESWIEYYFFRDITGLPGFKNWWHPISVIIVLKMKRWASFFSLLYNDDCPFICCGSATTQQMKCNTCFLIQRQCPTFPLWPTNENPIFSIWDVLEGEKL